jgi:hypothetical protein
MAIPNLPSLRNTNTMFSASRQLMEDLKFARLRAINDRTTVYLLLLPRVSDLQALNGSFNVNLFVTNSAANNLLEGQGAMYALYSRRSVGDQPGRISPHYLTEWRTLPEGIFVATNSFTDTNVFQTNLSFVFPEETGTNRVKLPYLAFGPNGELTSHGYDVAIPLARGGGLPLARLANDTLPVQDLELMEQPPGNSTNNFNHIVINRLTGRSRVERPELP